MIAGPSSALQMFIRRFLDARAADRRERERDGSPKDVINGGVLKAEADTKALLTSRIPDAGTVLAASPHVPTLPSQDVLSLPDRDVLRVVVPDYDHIEFG